MNELECLVELYKLRLQEGDTSALDEARMLCKAIVQDSSFCPFPHLRKLYNARLLKTQKAEAVDQAA